MTLVVAWIAFPLVITALALGCALALERLIGVRVPAALLAPLGAATVIVLAQFPTLTDPTAELATPLIVAAALAGWALVARASGSRRPAGWAIVAAAATYAVYAAPVVLSGEATFAGYIRLDDTATWLALSDHVIEHGRDVDGLAPSTYEATLAFNLADGYPIGVFLPLAVGGQLVGTDIAWLIQPYMAWLAAISALGLYALAPSRIPPPARAAAALVGAQAALLYGYYLWGGVKEVAAAALLAAAAALVPVAVARSRGHHGVALAVVGAALVGVLSGGGAVWLAPLLVFAAAVLAHRFGAAIAVRRTIGITAVLALLALPVLIAGGLLPPTSSPLTDDVARGNLIEPLDPAQVAGIWPAGDFRLDPGAELATIALIAVALVAAGAGLAAAWRSRAWAPVAYVGAVLTACAAIWALGSPWVDGKALAIASPAIPFAAALGAGALIAARWRAEGIALLVAVAAGVVWSNALAYRDVNLAPRDQLGELEEIGELIGGEGPTLLTEYQPYGARHFLRDADPEAASELRRRRVSLVGGGTLAKGETADTDELRIPELLVYRTVVLRRSPSQSRPPSAYRLVWRGEFYEVWQRSPAFGAPALEHLGLGNEVEPTAVPRCADVLALAHGSSPGDRLAAASPPAAIAIGAGALRFPREWGERGSNARPVPSSAGSLIADFRTPAAGDYEIWLGGSIRADATAVVDGLPAGSVRHRLNTSGQYVRLGEVTLAAETHSIEIQVGAADIGPGSGGTTSAVGPLVLSRKGAADLPLRYFRPGEARRLCGRRWDWIELLPAGQRGPAVARHTHHMISG